MILCQGMLFVLRNLLEVKVWMYLIFFFFLEKKIIPVLRYHDISNVHCCIDFDINGHADEDNILLDSTSFMKKRIGDGPRNFGRYFYLGSGWIPC